MLADIELTANDTYFSIIADPRQTFGYRSSVNCSDVSVIGHLSVTRRSLIGHSLVTHKYTILYWELRE
jgi:hypothetical protein